MTAGRGAGFAGALALISLSRARPRARCAFTALTVRSSIAAISSSDWSSTSLRITTLRCTVGSSTNRDTAVSTASRRISTSTGSGLPGSATSWAASMGSAARIARLRSRSSARLCAIRNSQARSGAHLLQLVHRDEGPGEGVLHHILALDHRAHQACAVAVKLGPQLIGKRQEFAVARR